MSNRVINVPGGKTARLLTAGKYCPEDISVYAEPVYIDTSDPGDSDAPLLPELTNPATESEVFDGFEYIDEAGSKKSGTFTVEEEVNNLKSLTSELLTALDGKAGAGVETCAVSIIDVGGILTVNGVTFVCYSAYENGRIATEFRFLPFEEDLGNSNLRAVLNNVVKGSQIVLYLDYTVSVSGENIVVGEHDTVAEDYGYFIFSVTVNADTEITLTGEP